MQNTVTRAQENTIIQLIRRGEHVSRIAQIVGVRSSDVIRILEERVDKEMRA